jgi:serine protease Do
MTGLRLRARSAAAVLTLALAAAAPIAAHAEGTKVPDSREEIRFSFAPVVKRVAPAVVNIRVTSEDRTADENPLYADPFYRRFFGNDQQRREVRRSVGSGVILRANGIIVTNHHVIKSGGRIDVILHDKRTFVAKVLLSDKRTDLAVLKIDTKGETLPYIDLRDSDEVEVGDLVLAIGNPFGVGQTVTSGIVSAVARTSVNIADFRSFIQTDASINPGNSGGALVTTDGKLIGINTAIISRSGGNVGIGFAIPSNMVRAVVRAALTTGRIARPTLGIGGQDVTPDIARARGLEHIGGVIVSRILPKSPAAEAGMKVGDVLLKVNGREIADIQDLRFRLATMPVGGTVKLTIQRDKSQIDLDVALREASQSDLAQAKPITGNNPLGGATVAKLTQELAQEMGLNIARGLVVTKVAPGSNAEHRGFRAKDVVLQINGVTLDSPELLQKVLDQSKGEWQIIGSRGGTLFRIYFSIQ